MREAGFTVWMPQLFGVDGKPVSLGYSLASMVRGCISREFRAFAAYQAALGDRFVGRVLPDSAANPGAPTSNPHGVVTAHLIDREGEPPRQAVDEILAFFRIRLVG